MERKTPLRAGGPALRTHPWYGVGAAARTHVRGARQTCDCIRTLFAGEQTARRFACAWTRGLAAVNGRVGTVVGGAPSVEPRAHAARRHAQRCGAPKAPLKGELAARNALSEGFCGRASGAWSSNALPTSLLLRKTPQSASLTAPLSGEPLASAALRVTTSSVALVDAVGRRPRWSCVTAAVRKRKRSGERFAHRQTGYGCSHKSAWHPVQCAAAAPTPYQGWVLRAGPPALSGVFLSIFFLRR